MASVGVSMMMLREPLPGIVGYRNQVHMGASSIKKARRNIAEIDDLLDYVKNIYRVLLTRGIRGTFVYVVDPHLREYLRPFFAGTR